MTAEHFGFDSGEYELLTQGIELSKDVPGICLEMGLRLGRGTATIIDAISQFCPDKISVAVDPYGSIMYEGREGILCRLNYTDEMKNTCLSNMYPYAASKQVHFKFIELTDKDFFQRYHDGIVVYNLERYLVNEYSFVHFDGPHNLMELFLEIDFFLPRSNKGAIWVFDDITPDFFDIKAIEHYMGDNVELVYMGQKKGIYRVC